MAVLIPDGAEQGDSLASMICNEINNIEFHDGKVWLVIRSAGDITYRMPPLLGPVCGSV